jgi:3-oxoacyl-[acyl-carrier-protein] synthase III
MHQSSVQVETAGTAVPVVNPAPSVTQIPSPSGNGSHSPSPSGNGSAAKSDSASAEASAKASTFIPCRKTYSLLGVQIIGTGSCVPQRTVTNADLLRDHGFDPAWIEQRSGIYERRHAPHDIATSDLCVEAGKRAMDAAGVKPEDIDLLVIGTFTPDHYCPSTGCLVQHRLGLEAPAFDLSAACSGFVYALTTAAQFVATGNARTVLVIGGDTNSRYINPNDLYTYPLFGDGAGAAVLTRGDAHQGLVRYQLGTDGSKAPMLSIPCGGTRLPPSLDAVQAEMQYIKMDGRNVFKWAVRALTDTIALILEHSKLTVNDVSLYVLHQANIRIINAAIEQLSIPPDRVFNNIQRYGNTSGGSIPIALDEAYRAGRIKPGETALMSGFGAGLTWGTALFRW